MQSGQSNPAPEDAARAEARARQTARVFRHQVLALAIFGLLVLFFSLSQAGWHNVFTRGWWRW
jgi:hypothetical protein